MVRQNLNVSENSTELEGLQATLDKLVHHREKSKVKGLNLHIRAHAGGSPTSLYGNETFSYEGF